MTVFVVIGTDYDFQSKHIDNVKGNFEGVFSTLQKAKDHLIAFLKSCYTDDQEFEEFYDVQDMRFIEEGDIIYFEDGSDVPPYLIFKTEIDQPE